MKIEDLIRKIRPSLDVEKPDEEYLWQGISTGINNERSKGISVWWKIAAITLLFITTGLLLHNTLRPEVQHQQLLFVNVSEELAGEEALLIEKINSYQKTLEKESNKSKLVTEFSELNKIDRLINQYSKDLEQYGPDPRILNTLMDLYHKKIMVMDRMLNEIQKNKRDENNKINI